MPLGPGLLRVETDFLTLSFCLYSCPIPIDDMVSLRVTAILFNHVSNDFRTDLVYTWYLSDVYCLVSHVFGPSVYSKVKRKIIPVLSCTRPRAKLGIEIHRETGKELRELDTLGKLSPFPLW